MYNKFLVIALPIIFVAMMSTNTPSQTFKQWNGKGYSNTSTVDATNPNDKAGVDTVAWGKYLGKDLLWLNKWWTEGKDTPGALLDSGGTSGWQIINSKSIGKLQWKGCDEDPSSAATVCIPTWMDGAKGGYSITHDDIGAMDMSYLEQSWKISGEINDANKQYFGGYGQIRLSYGVQVNESDAEDWAIMRDLVVAGHEICSHSYDHTSAAHQWLWYYQCDTTGAALTEINSFTLSGGDTIPKDTTNEDFSIPKWAQGAIVLSNSYASKPGNEEAKFGYKIKTNGTEKYIKCNNRNWINKCEVAVCILDQAARDAADGPGPKHFDGWDATEKDLNVNKASDTINQNVYFKLKTDGKLKNQYWPEDNKKCDYYFYPYDAYSEATHTYLDANGFVAARGGGKCSLITPGDFFHPYRTYFDSYFSDAMGEFPNNPHQWMTTTRMVNSIIAQYGYDIREFHAVTDNAYWGAIKPSEYRTHLSMVMDKIKAGDLSVYTCTDAVKYRILTDAPLTATIASSGDKKWLITPTCTAPSDKYKNILMNYIVTFTSSEGDASWKGIGARYKNTNEPVPRQPFKLTRRGADAKHKWSVFGSAFLGPIEITGDEIITSVINEKFAKGLKFHSFVNGQLTMYMNPGNFKATIYSAKGQAVSVVNGFAKQTGNVRMNMNVKSLSNGYYILSVEHQNGTLRMPIVLSR